MTDWDDFELEPLAAELRRTQNAPDAEKMIWAFERALEVGRVDPELLEHLLAAAVCLLAGTSERSPRDVLEAYFRRSVADDVWAARYRPLFAT